MLAGPDEGKGHADMASSAWASPITRSLSLMRLDRWIRCRDSSVISSECAYSHP